jgi:hypothetical protein
MSTSREDFVKTWLSETPQGLGNFETYEGLVYHIKDLLKSGIKYETLLNSLKKIELSQTLYYWYQDAQGTVILGVVLDKMPQGLVVRLTGKHPKFVGKAPYASDLYSIILKDNKTKSLRLLSDESLSDEGKKLWNRMFDMGFSISVYDQLNPGKTFQTFTSRKEMDDYFRNDDTNFKRYQYVLSENGKMLAETRSFFFIRRHRELVPGLL